MFAAVLMFAFRLSAQNDTNEIPQLRPLHAELRPTYWEQNGAMIVVLALVAVLALGLLVWLLTRPQAPEPVPPEVQARTALQTLPANLADGAKLSRVSQILREYVRGAFNLPFAELTTTEFCQAVANEPRIGPELAAALAEFLRDSDRRKFSAEVAAPSAVNAVTAALSLIEKCEARRAGPAAQPS